ncbi:MAG: hypothetical protein JNM17_19860 [Archangium sp.]|nr:hypothetical protein [Archangium sp.]
MSDEVVNAPPLPTFEPDARVCGNCKLWRANQLDEKRGWVGNCRVQPNRGLFPPSAPLCDAFSPRGEHVTATVEAVVPVKRARALQPIGPTVVRAGQERAVVAPRSVSANNLNEEIDLEGDKMTRAELMELFLEASGLTEVTMANKWDGGTVRLIPGDAKLQAKDLPIDALFHKVVMVRDRLRVLEQKINGHAKLTDVEKAEMQQYVTRCYGSLTTFNVLFKEKGDQFVGSKDDKE